MYMYILKQRIYLQCPYKLLTFILIFQNNCKGDKSG